MNTKPSTPFGKAFFKLGIWHPQAEDTIKDAYDKLSKDVQIAIKTSSGYIAIINANLDKTPDEVFELISKKFPGATRDSIKDYIAAVIKKMALYGEEMPATYEEALEVLKAWLKEWQGQTWVTMIRAVVAVGTEVLNPNDTMAEKVEFVLSYVYHTFIKKQAADFLPAPAGK